jgi:hypothetical protein
LAPGRAGATRIVGELILGAVVNLDIIVTILPTDVILDRVIAGRARAADAEAETVIAMRIEGVIGDQVVIGRDPRTESADGHAAWVTGMPAIIGDDVAVDFVIGRAGQEPDGAVVMNEIVADDAAPPSPNPWPWL